MVLMTLLTATHLSGNRVCEGDREEGRVNVFVMCNYLHNSQE